MTLAKKADKIIAINNSNIESHGIRLEISSPDSSKFSPTYTEFLKKQLGE